MKTKLLLIIALSVIFRWGAKAQPGSLDNSFSSDGMITTDFGGEEEGHSVAIQNDEKIIVIGYSLNGSNNDFALTRYNNNGTLDNTFGSGGKVTTDFANNIDKGNSVVIQDDNKIVVSGYSFNGSNYDFAVVRYNNYGTLDNTFGSNGKVTTDFGNSEYGMCVALQNDGKILVAGYSYNNPYSDIALARYMSNGSLDNSFGNSGKVLTDIGNSYGSTIDYGNSLAIQNDGKIIVVGRSNIGANDDFAVVRYNQDGTLDNTFSSDGKVTTNFSNYNDAAYSVALQGDGKILVTGFSYYDHTGMGYPDSDFALARYNINGTLDNTFSIYTSNGKITEDFEYGDDFSYSVSVQSDGKILVAGSASGNVISDPYLHFALIRYNNDGTKDDTFNSYGQVTTEISNYGCKAFSIGLQIDNKIVVAGASSNGSNGDFAVARYNNNIIAESGGITKKNSEINIFPNPTTGKFTLQIQNAPNAEIKIYNLLGEIIKQIPNTDYRTPITLDLSQQPKGIYFIQLNNSVFKLLIHQ